MSIKTLLSKFIFCSKNKVQYNHIELELKDLYAKMNRVTVQEIRHEDTVVVLLAEIRENMIIIKNFSL